MSSILIRELLIFYRILLGTGLILFYILTAVYALQGVADERTNS